MSSGRDLITLGHIIGMSDHFLTAPSSVTVNVFVGYQENRPGQPHHESFFRGKYWEMAPKYREMVPK